MYYFWTFLRRQFRPKLGKYAILKNGTFVQIFTGGGHRDQLLKTINLAIDTKSPKVKVLFSSDISEKTIQSYKEEAKKAFPQIDIENFVEWLARRKQ
jgi:hypothetical protein